MVRYSVRSAGFIGFLAVALAAGAASARPSGRQQVLSEEEVTTERVVELFQSALMNVTVDSDGDVVIADGGMRTFIRVDTSRKLISYFSIWPLRSSASEIDRLRLINRLNDQLIVVRFSVTQNDHLWCDYQMSFENGLTSYSIVNAYRLYARVVKGAVSTQDPDDLIGRD